MMKDQYLYMLKVKSQYYTIPSNAQSLSLLGMSLSPEKFLANFYAQGNITCQIHFLIPPFTPTLPPHPKLG